MNKIILVLKQLHSQALILQDFMQEAETKNKVVKVVVLDKLVHYLKVVMELLHKDTQLQVVVLVTTVVEEQVEVLQVVTLVMLVVVLHFMVIHK